nr:hypothetical protein [uncultured Mediterraneibacter sp.]
MLFENNEEKRSTVWRTVLTVSSILIIIIAVFFVVRLFTSNPLEGSWVSEDNGEIVQIRDSGELTVKQSDGSGDEYTLKYTVDTKTKVLTVQQDDESYAERALSGTYSYNVEQDTLTLTEREYGEQLVFVRQ